MTTSPCSLWGVIPVLTGPLQVLLAILPGLLIGLVTVLISLFKPSAMKQTALLVWRLKLPLAALAAVGFGGIWAVRAFWPATGSSTAAEAHAGDWPLFRGSPARRGAAVDAVGPTRGGLNWGWKDGSEIYSSPAIVGNRVYIATARRGALSESGALCCLDADSGAVLWQSAPPGYRPTFSSPAISGNRLVCGEGLHHTKDARILCLDLTPKHEGKVLWTLASKSHVECSPVIDQGRVYVGAGDDGYYCIGLEPDKNGKPRLHWHVPGAKYPDAETALAVHDGKVYAGLGNGGKALCVLDAATGAELHRLPTPYPVFGPPAIADGKLYVGMGNGDYVYSADDLREIQLERLRERGAGKAEIDRAMRVLAPGGEIWCIDLATLHIDWKYHVDETVLGAVAVMPDALYFGCRDGQLFYLDRAGKLVGKWYSHAPIIASPAVTARHVHIVTNAGTLYGLDRTTLEPLWEFRLGTQPLFVSSPTVAHGRVYVGTNADGFLCVGAPGKPDTPSWPGRLGGPGAAGAIDGSAIPAFPEQRAVFAGASSTVPAAVLGGEAFVPIADAAGAGIGCFSTKAAEKPRWIFRTRHAVHDSPAVHGERLFLVDGKKQDVQRRLHCLKLANGERNWTLPIAAGASGILALGAESIFVQDRADGLSQIALTGAKGWSQKIGRLQQAPCVSGWILVAAVADPPALVALDRGSGSALWRQPLTAPVVTTPVVSRTTIYLGTANGLEARSLIDGTPLPGWPATAGGVSGDFAVRRSDIIYVSSENELVIVDRTNGELKRRVAGAVAGFPPLVSRDTVLFVREEAKAMNIMQLALGEQGEPMVWLDGESLGRIVAPMLLADSHVYVGVAGKGLVQLGAAP